MGDRTRSQWADISDNDSWDEGSGPEEAPVQPQKKVQPAQVSGSAAWVANMSPPISLLLGNLSYSIKSESTLWKLFNLSPEEAKLVELHLEMTGNRFSGNAEVIVHSTEVAQKIASLHDHNFLERKIHIRFPYSERGGNRGRGGRGDRGGRRGDRGRRAPRNQRNQGAYSKQESFSSLYNDSGQLTIPPPSRSKTMADPKTQSGPPVEAKPRPNPFGDAKPVDTAQKEREFEEKLKLKQGEGERPTPEQQTSQASKNPQSAPQEELKQPSDNPVTPAQGPQSKESAETPQDSTKQTIKEEPKEEPKEKSQEDSKETPKEEPKEESKEDTKEEARETPKEDPQTTRNGDPTAKQQRPQQVSDKEVNRTNGEETKQLAIKPREPEESRQPERRPNEGNRGGEFRREDSRKHGRNSRNDPRRQRGNLRQGDRRPGRKGGRGAYHKREEDFADSAPQKMKVPPREPAPKAEPTHEPPREEQQQQPLPPRAKAWSNPTESLSILRGDTITVRDTGPQQSERDRKR